MIPGKRVRIGELSLAIAWKIALIFFDEDNFEKELIREHSIAKGFPPDWTRTDALSRWYSLGFICLTHCSKKSIWSEALTLGVGMQVYEAAVEKMWILWSMPEEVRVRVMEFMGTNIQSVTSSLNDVVDARTRTVWFRRYAARIKGENPPWEIQRGGQSSMLDELLSGGQVSTDLGLISHLSANFEALAEVILKLVTGAEPLP